MSIAIALLCRTTFCLLFNYAMALHCYSPLRFTVPQETIERNSIRRLAQLFFQRRDAAGAVKVPGHDCPDGPLRVRDDLIHHSTTSLTSYHFAPCSALAVNGCGALAVRGSAPYASVITSEEAHHGKREIALAAALGVHFNRGLSCGSSCHFQALPQASPDGTRG